MSPNSKGHLGRVLAMLPAALVFMCVFGALAAAQDQPAPKWEIYGGYSLWYPGADVHGTLPLGLQPLSSRLETNPRGIGGSGTYNFNRWLGFTLDGSTHWHSGENTLSGTIDDAAFWNLSVGPKLTFRSAHFSPFLEGLVGVHHLSPEAFHGINKPGFMVGGGLDINVTRHVALRLFRADYVVSSYQYGPAATTPSTDLRGVRLQSGLVFLFGGERTVATTRADCLVDPAEVFAGEPATATATAYNFNPKRTVQYNWSATGVRVSGSNASTPVDTTGSQPGPYQVTASLSDGSKYGFASCNARFLVKTSHPPVVACAADPTVVRMDGASTITSNATSPDGRRLTYSYTTSAGNVTGDTSTANLASRGAGPGIITVTCNVSDDHSPALLASATTTVDVLAAPPPPPLPDFIAIAKRLAIHSIYFATAKPNEQNPEAGLLNSQETTLTTLAADFKIYLQSKPDALLTLEGHTDPRGSIDYNQALSERRVGRAQRYLIEQGIPAANLQTKAFGKQQNLSDADVKDAVERNPELNDTDRQRVLNNMATIILASNRRVDITLTNAGQSSQASVRQYPFNAADSLTLLDTRGGTKKMAPRPRVKRISKK
ncbi:MAG TPA: OmpA family protein [Candidatus Saccharimonadales bacterium]|jgi:outer membrane protein OmpA-like peptidoglycan-associated protein|nr:OmpA family protein [Candidatus Saccharimonadales bacterium]